MPKNAAWDMNETSLGAEDIFFTLKRGHRRERGACEFRAPHQAGQE